MNIAVVTARGGSKRIPRKNIKDFCGRPIIAYSIEAALGSGVFDEVMVSTEDEEIRDIAVSLGAAYPFKRSDENADDSATTADVIGEVIEGYRRLGREPQTVCCIYPTAPFVTAGRLESAWRLLLDSGADAVVPVVRFSFPPQRCFVMDGAFIGYKWPQYERSRSQDLEPFYHDAGQFYFIRVGAFLSERSLIPRRTAPIVMDEMEVQDIDTLDDWRIAELKYRMMKDQG